jgi:hypothetical protein
MLKLLKSLLAPQQVCQPAEPLEWTQGDAAALHALLRTEAGERLASHLRHLVFVESMRLLSDGNPRESLEFRVGRASGIKAAVAYIDALAYVDTAEEIEHE